MKDPVSPPTTQRRRSSRTRTLILWFAAVGILVPGGYGFIEKFIQFVRTLRTEHGGGFTIIPILNYLIMAAGFVCLLTWAVYHGMFRDIEGPKYTMLEREEALQRHEGMREKS